MKVIKTGFAVVNVECNNCAFNLQSLEPEFEMRTFPIKEQLFQTLIQLHKEGVQIESHWHSCSGSKLTVKFCHTAEVETAE